MSGIRVVGGIASGVVDLCGDHSTCFRRVGVGSRIGLRGNGRAGRTRCDRKAIKSRIGFGPDCKIRGRRWMKRECDRPELTGIHARVGTSNGTTTLRKVALTITETTRNFGGLAGFAFRLWGWLKALYLFEATGRRWVMEERVKGEETNQLSQEVTRRGRFLCPWLCWGDSMMNWKESSMWGGVDKRNKSETAFKC